MTAYGIEERKKELDAEFAREDGDQFKRDIRAVLGTEAGRRLFATIVRNARVFGRIFQACGGDAIWLAYTSGLREKAAEIYAKANEAAPELVLQSFIESNTLSAERKSRMKAIENDLDADEQLERTDK